MGERYMNLVSKKINKT
ncbi:hypothetical protein F383_33936 [Gossypium arboreum]|uniref:Uncharacterized protein n=1 Tax=Gossypium arboreum TaxID=29729 RepID=A0A0B0PR98_GOSAR|nr:hypothetical protein F383_33936 [Gossypium arboreum]